MNTRPLALAAVLVLALAGCSGSDEHAEHASSPTPSASATTSSTPMDHSTMDHSTSSLPSGMKAATDARYPVGSQVVIHADHMAGMDGARGSVAGAYDTTTYAVTYTPTTGGAQVVDHKWVVAEELAGGAATKHAVGDQVVIEAEHMSGMKGAKATVTQVVTVPVYAVDYTATDGSMVHDHLWVTQDELASA